MQLFQEKDKARLSHGGQPSLSSHLPLIASFHRLKGERKETHTHTHTPREEGRKAELSPSPTNFQHFAEFLSAAGTSPPDRNRIPAVVGSATLRRRGDTADGPNPVGPPRWSFPLSARGVSTPSLALGWGVRSGNWDHRAGRKVEASAVSGDDGTVRPAASMVKRWGGPRGERGAG